MNKNGVRKDRSWSEFYKEEFDKDDETSIQATKSHRDIRVIVGERRVDITAGDFWNSWLSMYIVLTLKIQKIYWFFFFLPEEAKYHTQGLVHNKLKKKKKTVDVKVQMKFTKDTPSKCWERAYSSRTHSLMLRRMCNTSPSRGTGVPQSQADEKGTGFYSSSFKYTRHMSLDFCESKDRDYCLVPLILYLLNSAHQRARW